MSNMREPDLTLTREDGKVYLRRWWIIPRNNIFNVYLHQFLASDDDRALHDHPYASLSIILKGGYWEYRRNGTDTQLVDWRGPGAVIARGSEAAHRVELDFDVDTFCEQGDENDWPPSPDEFVYTEKPAWTLFITGPRVRSWGFWCESGWQHWHRFVRRSGCGEI